MSEKIFTYCLLILTMFSCVTLPVFSQVSNEQLASKVSPSVVYLLTGEGGGRLQATGSGFIVKENGVLLTAYHLIKNAREVQVRLKSGEVFDKVELLGYDERRDVAALRIQAQGLTALPLANADAAQIGEKVFVISNPATLTWSASDGILSAIRMADEVPTAGAGYKILQFTAPVSAGSSGAPVVDAQGRALGIITSSQSGQNLNFAIPVQSVAGLAAATNGTALGAGTFLRPPTKAEAPASAAIANTIPEDQLRGAKTIRIRSNTEFFSASQLETKLINMPEFKALKLLLIDDYRGGDLVIEVDRPLFTFDFTYKVTDTRTSVILASGKVTAWDSVTAAPELAKQIVKKLQAPRANAEPGTQAKNK
ncbi:MAG: serine protease [Acidobacteria bacterium]|nr:serine protease [Acidobacteriota bacterium]